LVEESNVDLLSAVDFVPVLGEALSDFEVVDLALLLLILISNSVGTLGAEPLVSPLR
jgi:hypothetical protein